MADLKYMANQRLTVALGLVSASPFGSSPSTPTVTQANTLRNVSQAVRFNGLTFGMKASAQNNDRSIADAPSAQTRGFNAFSGDVPFYLPTNYADTSDILQQAFTLVKTPGVGLWVMTRLGPLNNTPFSAADVVNLYQVNTDGSAKDLAGIVGGITVITFLPQGNVFANIILAPATPAAVVVTGGPAASTVVLGYFWAKATYQGHTIAGDAVWTSSDTTKLISLGGGLFQMIAAGAPTYSAAYPGATASTATTITIS